MSETLIQPRTLKGFRDYLPEAMLPREKLIDTAKQVYRRFGFSPIDTPALELLEILEGKGGEESNKQLYKFEDHGGREVAMRFDLTVPLARFVAQHTSQLPLPFKRYHVATVWRGEKPQTGRYREFMQCDFDTIGTRSVAADIECALVMHDLLRAIGFETFSIRFNNRLVLNGLLERLGLSEQSTLVLRALDKLPKVGPEAVCQELTDAAGASAEQAEKVVQLAALEGANDSILVSLRDLVADNETGQEGVERLAETLAGLQASGADADRFQIDVSIARGLDYYTGIVLETFLDDLPKIGSVCSGGRYDNLAGLFTKQELPGVGASLGLDRLLAAMDQLGLTESASTPADIFIPYFDKNRLGDYLHLAEAMRSVGFRVELYPDAKKLGQQLKYASKRGFALALIAGSDELDQQRCQVKDLRAQEARDVPLGEDYQELAEVVRELLSGDG